MYEIKLDQLFLNEGSRKEINHEADLTAKDNDGALLFRKPVSITGSIQNEARIVTITAMISADYYAVCDRCACDVVKHLSVPMEHTLVRELNSVVDADEYIVVPELKLDLDALAEEDLLLELPSKVLCSNDCKGLCPQCGKNLNEGPCGCEKPVDPRLESLAALLTEDE